MADLRQGPVCLALCKFNSVEMLSSARMAEMRAATAASDTGVDSPVWAGYVSFQASQTVN
ncbi:hypothetical protein [Shimia thalassica]|uniref:hypothetical protein n=1 Tax=Shimia thalassica TaxID=1715693 RepID=UPI0011A486F2|nr:hypothetical protein [Shimia thalassica]